ncbi:MAG: hypothetical protein E7436_06595 [Ruminococcaceae bacterium]|nr:hypothetical protein [Oscillospiraceae bacterium]
MEEYEVIIRKKSGSIAEIIGGAIVVILLLFLFVKCGNNMNNTNNTNGGPVTPTYPDEIKVAELSVAKTIGHAYVDQSQDTGPSGKVYEGPCVCMHSSYNSLADDGEQWNEASISFKTEGHYSTLTGTFYAAAQEQWAEVLIVFKVYADGVLIYESLPINMKTEEASFSVDIQRASILTFAAEGVQDQGYSGIMGGVTVCVVDAQVSK